MKVNNTHVRNVITRRQKGGVLDSISSHSISSQCMKVDGIHVRSVIAGQSWTAYQVNTCRDGDFDVKT